MGKLEARVATLEGATGAAPLPYTWAAQDQTSGLWSVGPGGPQGLTTAQVDDLTGGNVKTYIGLSPDDWEAQ